MSHTFRQKSQLLQQTGTTIAHNHTPGAAATVAIMSIVVESVTARTGGAPTIDGVTATQVGTSQLSAECRAEVWYVCKAFSGSQFATSTPNAGALVCNISVITADAGTGFDSAYHAFDEDQGTAGTEDSTVLTVAPNAVGDFLYARIGSDENANASVTGASGTNWDAGLVQLYSDDIGNQTSMSHYSIADSTAGANTITYTFSNAGYAAIAVVFKSVAGAVDKTPADSGVGTDAQTIQGTPALVDSGSGAEAQIIAAALALADTGAGVDALTILESLLKALDDSGAGTDAISALVSTLAAADGGSGSDLVDAIQAALDLAAETGSGADILSALDAALSFAESGSGSELLTLVQTASAILAETGSGQDDMSLDIEEGADKVLSDSGAGVDVLLLAIGTLLGDSGSGVDGQIVYVTLLL